MVFNDMLGANNVILLSFCRLNHEIKIYEIEEPYDPSYLNLDPKDRKSWKIYAEKIRDIYSKVL